MAASQGGGGGGYTMQPSAPSAPPAPSAYSSQQGWHQATYSAAPSSYSSVPPTLSYSDSLRHYDSPSSFGGSGRVPTSPYGDPQQPPTPNTYGQQPHRPAGYAQAQVPPAHYGDPSKMTPSYQSQTTPAYGQPANAYSPAPATGYAQSYGPPPSGTYGQPPSQSSYGQAGQPGSYGKPAGSPYAQQGYEQQSQYSAAAGSYPPAAYPGYNYTQGLKPKAQFPPGTDQEIVKAFEMGDVDGSGLIDASELGRVLSTGLPFSMRTVHLMLHLYSTSGSTKIGPTEFAALWRALKDWKTCFERFDRDRSGRIDFNELRDGLLSMGYALSPPLLSILISKYDRTGQSTAMDYDNFVECGLVVKVLYGGHHKHFLLPPGLTDRFKTKDTRLTGSATIDFESFMQMVLPFIVA